jgi:hypothetical protein
MYGYPAWQFASPLGDGSGPGFSPSLVRYRRLTIRRAVIISCLALAFSGCQGGGTNPPPFNTGTGVPTSTTQSATVTPSGGSVSATLGTQTVTVRVPSGALSGPATVKLTVYSAPPKPLQSTQRKAQSVGHDAVLLVEFAVSVSGATLLKPLQANYVTPAAPSGDIFRLAGYGTSFDDVDTVTFSSAGATSDLNTAFARMSLADPTSGTLYAFYAEPSSEAGGVPGPVITVATASTLPVGMLGTATFTASEAESNGFPYLDPSFTFALDNATIGSLNSSTGVFTARYIDGAGTITVTDPTAGRGNPHGSTQVTVSSQRPGNVGDTFNFTGTLSSTTQLVNSNPTQPQTDTANVTVATSVTSAQAIATPVPGVLTIVHSNETDAYPVLTIKTATDTGYGYVTSNGGGLPAMFVAGAVVETESRATDSNGVTYDTQYDPLHGSGLIDVLPETAGPFGPNTAAMTYTETDQAGYSRVRSTNADGSYTEQGTDSLHDVQTITVNPDLSMSYDARQYSGLRFTATAPSGAPPRIIFRVFNSAGTQLAAFNIPSWIPASLTQPSSETDVSTTGVAFPAGCNVPAKYGTSGNRIVQTINRADTALGNLETLSTATYTSGTAGPVCIQMSDSVQTFYDYTLQNGFSVLVSGGTTPIQLTAISETLTLQSAKTSGGVVTQSTNRTTSSAAASTPASFAPIAFAKARFEHAVRQKLNWMRKETFNRNFMSQGVHQL